MVQVVRLLYPVGFQHTAAQRQLVGDKYGIDPDMLVSRHSRLKAADGFIMLTFVMVAVSTHSCTKAAEYIAKHIDSRLPVSTHSRPKAAGQDREKQHIRDIVSTHSRPKAAGIVFN